MSNLPQNWNVHVKGIPEKQRLSLIVGVKDCDFCSRLLPSHYTTVQSTNHYKTICVFRESLITGTFSQSVMKRWGQVSWRNSWRDWHGHQLLTKIKWQSPELAFQIYHKPWSTQWETRTWTTPKEAFKVRCSRSGSRKSTSNQCTICNNTSAIQ